MYPENPEGTQVIVGSMNIVGQACNTTGKIIVNQEIQEEEIQEEEIQEEAISSFCLILATPLL